MFVEERPIRPSRQPSPATAAGARILRSTVLVLIAIALYGYAFVRIDQVETELREFKRTHVIFEDGSVCHRDPDETFRVPCDEGQLR